MKKKLKILLIISLAGFLSFMSRTIINTRLISISDIIGIPEELLNHFPPLDKTFLQADELSVSLLESGSVNIPLRPFPNHPLYFFIENTGDQKTYANPVINDKNWTSIAGIVNTALKEVSSQASAEDKAVALWKYVYNNIASSYPIIDDRTFNPMNNPVLLFNVFGYGLCGNFSSALTILADKAGLKSRRVDLEKHSVTEIYYENAWHMFDSNLGIIIKNDNGSIASVEEIFDNPRLLNQLKFFPKRYISGHMVFKNAFLKKVIKGYFSPKRIWRSLTSRTASDMTFRLNPGEKVLFFNVQRRQKLSAFLKKIIQKKGVAGLLSPNGVLISDLNSSKSENEQEVTINFPYPIIHSYIQLGKNCDKLVGNTVYISKNKSDWLELKRPSLCTLKSEEYYFAPDDNYPITNKYYLKVNTPEPLTNYDLKIFTLFQFSPNSIPNLNSNNILKINSEDLTSKLKLTFGVANDWSYPITALRN